jgi:hypothetical protein
MAGLALKPLSLGIFHLSLISVGAWCGDDPLLWILPPALGHGDDANCDGGDVDGNAL